MGAVFCKTDKQVSAHRPPFGRWQTLPCWAPVSQTLKRGYAVCASVFVLSESEKKLGRCGLADELLKFPVIWFFEGKRKIMVSLLRPVSTLHARKFKNVQLLEREEGHTGNNF